MTFNQEEHFKKLIQVMKQEGVYEEWKKQMRRGKLQKAAEIVEGIYDKHGQHLDGDLTKKHSEQEVREELGLEQVEK